MKIQFLGHSCFKLTESTGTTIITDPYSGLGYELPNNLTSDAVTVSHNHFDHNNVKKVCGQPQIIDKEGFSQEECGDYMHIARTTVQQIYTNARKKLAETLVEGLPLRIEGGDYQLCDGKEHSCGCGGCRKHRAEKML